MNLGHLIHAMIVTGPRIYKCTIIPCQQGFGSYRAMHLTLKFDVCISDFANGPLETPWRKTPEWNIKASIL